MSTKKVAARPAKPGAAAIETADRPEKIRNVALVGHSGAGKTTLVEALLAATGTIARAGTVADGNTVSDHDPVEVAQQRSVALAVCPLTWDNVDGQPARHPRLPRLHRRAARRAAGRRRRAVRRLGRRRHRPDHRLAVGGVRRARHAARGRDHQAGRAARRLSTDASPRCQQVFGGADGQAVLPLYLPVGGDRARHPAGWSACCPARSTTTRPASRRRSPSPARRAAGRDRPRPRGALIEAIINNSEDETLLERYLAGEDIGARRAHRRPRDRGRPRHVLPGAAGLRRDRARAGASCWRCIAGGFPSAASSSTCPPVTTPDGAAAPTLSCDPDGPLLAEVVRTTRRPVPRPAVDPAGVLRHAHPGHRDAHLRPRRRRARATPTTTRTSGSARSSPRSAPRCARSRARVAGDICAVGRLGVAETGDTISAKGHAAADRAVGDARAAAADRRAGRDPGRRGRAGQGAVAADGRRPHACAWSATRRPRQLVLWCLGEAHADVVLERLRATARRSRPCRCGSRCGRRSPPRPRGHGRRSSSPAATASTPCATSSVTPLPRGSGVRVRGQGRRRRGAAPVHRLGREGRAGPARARTRQRPRAGHRRAGHPAGRQGAQRRLLRRRVPDRRRAGGQGRRGARLDVAARTGGASGHHGARRARRRR